MTLPSSVDLRSAYEAVYNQGSDNSCGAHAITACLDCIYERSTGVQHRFEKDYIWNWSKWHRGISSSVNTGMDFPSAEATLRINGAKLVSKDNQPTEEIIKGFKLVRSRFQSLDSLKQKLAMGLPLLYTINVPKSFGNGTDWRKHTVEYDKEFSGGLHYVAVVGYDDACQRFLFENSWGAGWGDGGFFGVPYDQMTNAFFMQGADQIDVLPVLPKKYEGFKMPAYMLTNDKVEFTDRAMSALQEMLLDEMTRGGVQSLINLCAKWGVSDKHLEAMHGWERGAVRGFKQDNPGLVWDGFVWDQL